MPHVVIVGGGFAGLAAARTFERRMGCVADLRVTLIDKNNYMLFSPMLPETASGSVDPHSIAQPFRALLQRVAFELGEVIAVDEQRACVQVRHPITHDMRRIDYDELIFALGSTSSTFGIPGAARFTMQLRTLGDAMRIRNAVLEVFEVASRTRDVAERDRLSRFVIVGGGFTGVEAAGELNAFARSIIPYYRDAQWPAAEFVLLQREDRLLPHLPAKFGKYAARVLAQRGVRIVTKASVASVDAGGVSLDDGRRFDSRTVVWAAGTEPSPIVARLGLRTSEHGAIQTASDFRIPGHNHLWAIGDIAAVPSPGSATYAPLAQNAVREGPLAARNVLAVLRGRRPKPFRYRPLGQMASLGDRHAIAQLPGGLMLTGLPAWLLWRAYYLSRLPGAARRARVAADWALGATFPPQLVALPRAEHSQVSFKEFHATRQ